MTKSAQAAQVAQAAKTLDLYPIDYPFETLVSRLDAKPTKLILDPDFQREYKWDKDGWVRSSRFIESCLMRIPLPSCYFAEDEDGRHLVIDGVQRLTTIYRFFKDEFALEGMAVFKELEGKKFSGIGHFKSELESTTIRCIVLRKENPKNLVREIFARLNQGAVQLTAQEIRHAIYPGTLDNLLVELSKTPIIANFSLGENTNRLRNSREADEQVLRFFAFSDDIELKDYDNILSTYLDNYMEKNISISKSEINKLKRKFEIALKNCEIVFGDDVFTDTTRDRQRHGLTHYDLLMPTVGLLDMNLVTKKAKNIKAAYERLCKSPAFKKTQSGGLQKKSSIMQRRELWNTLLQKAIA